MIIRPLFPFGTLKGPIPLLHVWSSYFNVLTDMFKIPSLLFSMLPLEPTEFSGSQQVVNMVIRGEEALPRLREEGEKRDSASYSTYTVYLVVHYGIHAWKWKRSSFLLSFNPFAIHVQQRLCWKHTHCYQWITNQNIWSHVSALIWKMWQGDSNTHFSNIIGCTERLN